jgi:hypothetical protein
MSGSLRRSVAVWPLDHPAGGAQTLPAGPPRAPREGPHAGGGSEGQWPEGAWGLVANGEAVGKFPVRLETSGRGQGCALSRHTGADHDDVGGKVLKNKR